MTAPEPRHALLAHNDQVLAQAASLAAAHDGARRALFADGAGPHLRHVIEHYDALLSPAEPGVVDYDDRPRDRRLEHDPVFAVMRLQALQRHLLAWSAQHLADTLRVRGLAGAAGQWPFDVPSTVARELVFVASHAVHHFALLRSRCQAHGIDLPPDFGVAPATVAHARSVATSPALSPASTPAQETPCRAH